MHSQRADSQIFLNLGTDTCIRRCSGGRLFITAWQHCLVSTGPQFRCLCDTWNRTMCTPQHTLLSFLILAAVPGTCSALCAWVVSVTGGSVVSERCSSLPNRTYRNMEHSRHADFRYAWSTCPETSSADRGRVCQSWIFDSESTHAFLDRGARHCVLW